MKIRNGFVSNSSSSSFLLYGVCFEGSDDILEYIGDSLTDEQKEEFEIYDFLDEIDGLQTYSVEYGGYYVGLEWDNVGDDETGAQFKERVRNKIKEHIPGIPDDKFETHSEAWYN